MSWPAHSCACLRAVGLLGVRSDAHSEVRAVRHRRVLHRDWRAFANLSVDLRILVHDKVHLALALAGNFERLSLFGA